MRSLSELAAAAGTRTELLATRARALPALVVLVRRAARAYGVSPLAVARRLPRLRRQGFSLHPYFLAEVGILGLLDPALPERRLARRSLPRRGSARSS